MYVVVSLHVCLLEWVQDGSCSSTWDLTRGRDVHAHPDLLIQRLRAGPHHLWLISLLGILGDSEVLI